MQTITLVTGSKGKLAEWQRLFPSELKLESIDVDLDEIQSLDLRAIITDKAKRAHEKVGKPVIVDDISAGIDELNGLPGPFVKFFEKSLGRGALYKLANREANATITAIAAYYDGAHMLIGVGEIHGKVVAPRGESGFGFDFSFVPEGYTQTFSEMGPAEKDKISHRRLAVEDLIAQLRQLN
jgi:non-canonical purine NTP pyrophosphatase (RdgB/HAM1 family)